MAVDIVRGQDQPLIRVQGLTKIYVQHRPLSRERLVVRALDGIDLIIRTGSSFALVGESGSGKSTLALCLARLEPSTEGQIWFEGQDLLSLKGHDLMRARGRIQLIFQDTAAALNPRLPAEEIIIEPMRIQAVGTRAEQSERAAYFMEKVGLPPAWLNRRPHQFSGGQRQRLAIARALILEPRLLILDEAFTGLDLSIQAQIVGLLRALQSAEHLTYLFISHDLRLMACVADEIAILHRGRIVEQGWPSELFSNPRQPQTRALLDAIPGRSSVLGIGTE
jgi:ABC-type glutathione transport system ATPase component